MDDFGMGYALGQDSGNASNNGGGMWGGDGSWIFAFLIIALIFGRNGLGGWGGESGGYAGGMGTQGTITRSDLCSEFAFNDLQRAVAGVNTGLCDGFYAMNTGMLNGFNGLGAQMASGFAGVDSAVCNLGYQTAQLANGVNLTMMQGFNGVTAGLNGLSTQLASCCCDTQRQVEKGFCDLNYNLATQECQTRQTIQDTTRDILDNQNCNTRAILDFLTQDKISTLQAENQSLKFAASQASQNAFITANQEAQTAELIRRLGRDNPVPAFVVPNPNCCYGYGTTYAGNSCGCGSCGC